jgi:DNA replication protein DnaC
LVTTEQRAGRVGFHRRHWGVAFARLTEWWEAPMWRAFARYLAQLEPLAAEGVGLIFEGTVGAGKTSCLALIAEAEARRLGDVPMGPLAWKFGERSPRLLYLTMPELADFLLQRNTDEDWERRFDRLKELRVLFLDEVGTEYLEPFGLNRLFVLLDHRTQNNRVTHLALNGRMEELARTAVGARLYDRLLASNPVVTLTGASKRRPRTLAEL